MLTTETKQRLQALCAKYGGKVTFDSPLELCTTIGIGGTAEAWYEPFSPEELKEARMFLSDIGIRAMVVGKGSNILFPDGRLDGVLINLSAHYFCEKRFEGERLFAGGGAPLGSVVSECCKAGLGGLEGLVGIPGTVGGALRMNAGYKTCVSDCLEKVLVMDVAGDLKWYAAAELDFGYRSSSFDKEDIVIDAVFKLRPVPEPVLMQSIKNDFADKMRKQPLDKRTLGSIFKNPPAGEYKSAQMIDMAGLKGRRIGGASVSEKHANFIENTGGAKASDVVELIHEIERAVRERFRVELETEIQIL